MRTIAVALAATVVAVAGCAPATVAGTATAPSGAAETSAALERAPAAAAVYRDVTGEAQRFDLSSDPTQWAPLPEPGSLLIPQPNNSDDGWSCTIGPAVTGTPGSGRVQSDLGYLTAGHCADTGTAVGIFTDSRATRDLYIGTVTDSLTSADADHGVVWTFDLAMPAGATWIAGRPVVGIMRESAVRELPAGTPVCTSGGWTGVRCVPLRLAGSLIRYPHATDEGDSGAPLFVVDGAGSVILIGLHSGTEGRDGVGTYLEPALRELGARIVTEPGAVAADPDLLAPELAISR